MRYCILGLFIALLGCGENRSIAEQVRFQANFSEMSLGLRVQLNPMIQIKDESQYTFESLGKTRFWRDENSQSTWIEAKIFVSHENIQKAWPADIRTRFPNGKKLPRDYRRNEPLEWLTSDSEISPSFIYQWEPELLVGGAFYSSKIADFPKNFMIIQQFEASASPIKAFVAAVGPQKDTEEASFYFIANFGPNPFASLLGEPPLEEIERQGRSTIVKSFVPEFPIEREIFSLPKVSAL